MKWIRWHRTNTTAYSHAAIFVAEPATTTIGQPVATWHGLRKSRTQGCVSCNHPLPLHTHTRTVRERSLVTINTWMPISCDTSAGLWRPMPPITMKGKRDLQICPSKLAAEPLLSLICSDHRWTGESCKACGCQPPVSRMFPGNF